MALYRMLDCGCEVRGDHDVANGLQVVLCPLHAAAPQLLEACEEALEALEIYVENGPSVALHPVRNAIRAAKGE